MAQRIRIGRLELCERDAPHFRHRSCPIIAMVYRSHHYSSCIPPDFRREKASSWIAHERRQNCRRHWFGRQRSRLRHDGEPRNGTSYRTRRQNILFLRCIVRDEISRPSRAIPYRHHRTCGSRTSCSRIERVSDIKNCCCRRHRFGH